MMRFEVFKGPRGWHIRQRETGELVEAPVFKGALISYARDNRHCVITDVMPSEKWAHRHAAVLEQVCS